MNEEPRDNGNSQQNRGPTGNEQEDPKTGQSSAAPQEEGVDDTTDRLSLDQLAKERDQAQNDLLYLRAEFDNYKKQMIKERSDYMKYGSERLLVEILDVLDNFDRALQADVSDDAKGFESFRQGMSLTANELQSVLKRFGVEVIECEGQPFDPHFHEALGSEESDQVDPGYITRVFRNGYKLHERIIRPGQVIVAKAPSQPSSDKSGKPG